MNGTLTVVNTSTGEVTAVPLKKPHIERLIDEYARSAGQPWCCTHAGLCARGTTPKDAYDKLMRHFDWMRTSGRRELHGVPRR